MMEKLSSIIFAVMHREPSCRSHNGIANEILRLPIMGEIDFIDEKNFCLAQNPIEGLLEMLCVRTDMTASITVCNDI